MKGVLDLVRRLGAPAPAVGQTPADAVHRENKWQLLRYRARPQGIAWPTPILLIPSLINRHYVLDLRPGRSFVEYLVAHGHDVYIIDWGTPSDEDRYLDFDEVCDRYIGRAIRVAARCSDAESVHVLGYCLGGTLAAIHTAARPERVASLLALAAPIDFEEAGTLAQWTRTASFDVASLTRALGNVPWPLMQTAFHLLEPTLNLSKLVGVIDRAGDDEFLDGFFALERWGNDNVSFPGAAYETYIRELYRGNALVRGSFALSGTPVRLGAIRCPTLAVSFAHDHIVPTASASALVDLVGDNAEHWLCPGGHVGAMVSRKAATNLWPRLLQWWRTTEARRVGAATPVHRSARAV